MAAGRQAGGLPARRGGGVRADVDAAPGARERVARMVGGKWGACVRRNARAKGGQGAEKKKVLCRAKKSLLDARFFVRRRTKKKRNPMRRLQRLLVDLTGLDPVEVGVA